MVRCPCGKLDSHLGCLLRPGGIPLQAEEGFGRPESEVCSILLRACDRLVRGSRGAGNKPGGDMARTHRATGLGGGTTARQPTRFLCPSGRRLELRVPVAIGPSFYGELRVPITRSFCIHDPLLPVRQKRPPQRHVRPTADGQALLGGPVKVLGLALVGLNRTHGRARLAKVHYNGVARLRASAASTAAPLPSSRANTTRRRRQSRPDAGERALAFG